MKGEFYKMDFRAWNNGTIDLSLEQEAAYLRLCHAMYDIGGPVPNSNRLLRGIFRCGNVKAAALLQQLVNLKKIEIQPNGELSNKRVLAELASRELLSTKRSIAGGRGGAARSAGPSYRTRDRPPTSASSLSEDWAEPDCSPAASRLSSVNPLKTDDEGQSIASHSGSRGEEKRGDSTSLVDESVPDRFEEFQLTYPKRNTAFPIASARNCWQEAIKLGTKASDIILGARGYAEEQERLGKAGTQYVKTADAWLLQKRWMDYAARAQESEVVRAQSDDVWRTRVIRWQERRGHWPYHGAAPDEPGTDVPRHILKELNVPTRDAPPSAAYSASH